MQGLHPGDVLLRSDLFRLWYTAQGRGCSRRGCLGPVPLYQLLPAQPTPLLTDQPSLDSVLTITMNENVLQI